MKNQAALSTENSSKEARLYLGFELMSIPGQVDHLFRSKSSTDSDSSRPVIPIESVHRFRREADHFFGAVGIGGRHVGIGSLRVL